MSLAHALLSQGVPSVVHTLWRVDDEAAEAFAVEFHRALTAGRSRAGAVRDATCALFTRFPERPDWWGAYALAGAPESIITNQEGEDP
jgi:CHAT domain-containing protein